MSIKVMKMALEALEAVSKEMTVGERYTNAGQQVLDAIDHLRVAISQQPACGCREGTCESKPAGCRMAAEVARCDPSMKLTVHTERGTFTSKAIDPTPEQAEQLQNLIETIAAKGTYFKLDTATGYVVLGKDLLSTAAFVVDA